MHLIGLVSDGGVHSSLEHLEALVRMGAGHGVSDLVVHAFTDAANSASWDWLGSNVSVTICCAGTETTARSSAAPIRNFLMPESPCVCGSKPSTVPRLYHYLIRADVWNVR